MKRKWSFACLILVVSVSIGCQNNKPVDTADSFSSEEYYSKAIDKLISLKYDSTMILLDLAFSNGFENPMRIIQDSTLYAIIDSPEYRPEIRALLKNYSHENHAVLVRQNEQGQRIHIHAKILDESDSQPMADVSVELVHADSKGLYFDEESLWNPRIFAYLKTNIQGEFSANTIQPGRYKDDGGNDVPSHIHFTLEAEGYRMYASEFTFETDSIFIATGNIDDVPVATKIQEEGLVQYQLILYMQRE